MNAVERLWRGIAAGDWAAIRAQLHPHAVIEHPHDGRRLDVAAYAAVHHRPPGSRIVQVHAIVASSEDLPIAVHATVTEDGVAKRVAGFYAMHQARIAHGVELWVTEHPPVTQPRRTPV